NLRFDLQPAAIAFPETPSQVAEVVKIGAQLNYNVVAQSGGHSYIANGLGGKNGSIVVDLRRLDEMSIEPTNNTAQVGMGNRLGNIALVLGASGRGLPHESCTYIGVGGHACYGDYGLTSRMWALTLDNIASLDVVLANSTLVKASRQEHSNLFWAMRGAGGSFGITTSIEFKTHPVPGSRLIYTYQWILNVMDATQALDDFQTFIQSDIPAELGPMLYSFPGAPKGFVLFRLTGGWYGDVEKLNSTLEPFLDQMPTPMNVIHQNGTFLESLQWLGGGFNQTLNTTLAPDTNDTFYAKSIMTLTNQAAPTSTWEGLMLYLANEGNEASLSWAIKIEVHGRTNSAINTVSVDDTTFVHHGSLFTFQIYVSSPDHKAPYPQEGFDFTDGLANSIIDNSPSGWNYGAYPNYIDDRLADWQQRYYGAHYEKLQAIKRLVDPSNVFAFPTSIEPLK
ncbi:Reticuline oxidase, partial [Leucoagaricus sp. SymC.cos]